MVQGYELVELDQRVPDIEPAVVTRFFWRAERVAHRRNRQRMVHYYRWVVVEEDGRWKVLAFQNALRPREGSEG